MGGYRRHRHPAARRDVRAHRTSHGHERPAAAEQHAKRAGIRHDCARPGAAGRPHHGRCALDGGAKNKHARAVAMTSVRSNPARSGSFWAFMVIGGLIFVGGFTALYYRQQPADDANGARSRQQAGESIAGKNDTSPANAKDPSRAHAIQHTDRPQVALTAQQKQRLSDLLKGEQQARRDSANFTISIGSTVPRQIELSDRKSTRLNSSHANIS